MTDLWQNRPFEQDILPDSTKRSTIIESTPGATAQKTYVVTGAGAAFIGNMGFGKVAATSTVASGVNELITATIPATGKVGVHR
jgi:uncharacterized RmlC-like cupin family protein